MMQTINRRTLLTGLAATALQTGFPALAGPTPEYLKSLPPDKRAEFEAQHARMMAALPYERVTVPGAQAWSEWQRLKTAGRGWPIIVGNDEGLERIAEQFSLEDPTVNPYLATMPGQRGPRPPAEIIKTAAGLTWPADYDKWRKDSGNGDVIVLDPSKQGRLVPFSDILKQPSIEDYEAPVGDWPSEHAAASSGPSGTVDLRTGKPLDHVHILLIPTDKSWEVPAYLRWGNWNACPPPEYHVLALKAWHERYGAELVGISGDTMDLHVARPPQSRDAALALAREQYRYCSDIVDQGVGTLAALADGLMGEPWWFFWWD